MPTLLEPLPRARIPNTPGSQLTTMVAFVLVTGILYFGRDVLVPLALSVLLTFLLAPGVRWLERRRFPRALATTVMVGLACCVIAGLVWVTVAQFLNFAASLPEYKNNIQSKISLLRSDPQGSLSKARQTIDEIGTEIAKQDAAAAAAPAPRGAPRSSRLPAAGRPSSSGDDRRKEADPVRTDARGDNPADRAAYRRRRCDFVHLHHAVADEKICAIA